MSGLPKPPNVVEGEASESDDDTSPPAVQTQSEPQQILPKQQVPRNPRVLSSVVVPGEASESDDEIEELHYHADLPPLRVDANSQGYSVEMSVQDRALSDRASISSSDKVELKYDTLLHRKLRETNAALRRSLNDSVGQAYVSSSKEIQNITQQLHKSQASIQDISHNMRLLTNDLFHLEDKIDIIASCSLLPNMNICVSSDINGAVESPPP